MSYDVWQLKNKPIPYENFDLRIIYINTSTLNNIIHSQKYFFIIFKLNNQLSQKNNTAQSIYCDGC